MDQIFPPLTHGDILACQFSSWYPRFKHVSIKSTIIRPLGDDFRKYILSDGVYLPDSLAEDTESADSEDEEEEEEPRQRFAFPELDNRIKETIEDYEAVFPKLNFSSPKDAAWMLPSSDPLKCICAADVYTLLKSSDFVLHDVDRENVFDGCGESAHEVLYELELVLRKWYHVNPSREFRCFVRNRQLIGISQRDHAFYEYMCDQEIREKIMATVKNLWDREIKEKWDTPNYVFDLILTRNLDSAHIVDFNPYASRTDPLLFDYEELRAIYDRQKGPVLKTIDSSSHEAVNRSTPANVHNMVPLELLDISAGKTLEEFTKTWEREIRNAN